MRHESLFFFRYNNARQWLNIDLGTMSRVKRISTQGRYDADQWVTSYAVSYSVDNIKFYPYKEKGRIKVRSIPLLLKKLVQYLFLSEGNSSVLELTKGIVRESLLPLSWPHAIPMSLSKDVFHLRDTCQPKVDCSHACLGIVVAQMFG